MNSILHCPNCHSRLVGISKIHDKESWQLLLIYGYCPSIKCRVKRVVFDSDCRVLNVEKYRNLDVKKKIIAKILRENWKNYRPKTKRKLWSKYEKLKPFML